MEKVKVTQEQEQEIKSLNITQKPFFVSMHAKGILANEHLKELTLDELIRCLYVKGSYEVELEFKVGDWAYNEPQEATYQITDRHLKHINDLPEKSHLRHATPSEIAKEKERRFWKKHDRDVWEIRSNDLLINKHNKLVYEIRRMDSDGYYKLSNSEDDMYFLKKDIKEHFEVVCFAENRLDGDSNENHRLD